MPLPTAPPAIAAAYDIVESAHVDDPNGRSHFILRVGDTNSWGLALWISKPFLSLDIPTPTFYAFDQPPEEYGSYIDPSTISDPLVLLFEQFSPNHAESPAPFSLFIGHIPPGAGDVWVKLPDTCIAAGEGIAFQGDFSRMEGTILEPLTLTPGASIDVPELVVDTELNRCIRVAAAHTSVDDLHIVHADNDELSDPPFTFPSMADVFFAGPTAPTDTYSSATLVFSVEEIGIPCAVIERDEYRLGPGLPSTVLIAPAVTGPVAYGPRMTTGIVPDLQAAVYRRPNLNDPIVVLDESYNKRFLDKLNDTGSGSVQLDNDDPDLALIEFGDLVRFSVKGEAALTAIIRDDASDTINEGEEHDQTTTLTGPGHLAVLEEAVVYPARGLGQLPIEEDRVFNWAAVDFDDAGWPNATQLARQGDGPDDWSDDEGVAWPEDWPDPDAHWIGPSTGTEFDAPPGDNYLRATFTAGTGAVLIYAAADNLGDLWVDGQHILNLDGFRQYPAPIPLLVTPGVHTIAVHIWNAPDDLAPGDNPTGLICAVYDANAATGLPIGRIPILRSDSSWRISEYPPGPPGMTPGEAIRHLIEEAQARGALLGVDLMCTDEVDSDGVPFPVVADIATKVGTDYLTFIKELTASYIDVRMAPGTLELYVWNTGGCGVELDVSFHPPTDENDPDTGNLVALQHRTVESPGNGFLVRWINGWIERTDATAIEAHGRREALLTIGAVQSVVEARRVADRQLDHFSNPRTEIAADLEPSKDNALNDTPYLSFRVGDTVIVPDRNGDPTSERIIAMTVSEDEDGQVSYAPELKDSILDAYERWEQTLKKMADGTLRGVSQIATPVADFSSPAPTCCPPMPPDGGET